MYTLGHCRAGDQRRTTTGLHPFIPDPGEHGTTASIGHYLQLNLSPAWNAPALLLAVPRAMQVQVQVQREDSPQHTRIYNDWPVYATDLAWFVAGWARPGFSQYFLFFSFFTSYHTVRCLSARKIPLGKDLQTRKSCPICSEMMFDLVPTKRQGQGLDYRRTEHQVHSTEPCNRMCSNFFSPRSETHERKKPRSTRSSILLSKIKGKVLIAAAPQARLTPGLRRSRFERTVAGASPRARIYGQASFPKNNPRGREES